MKEYSKKIQNGWSIRKFIAEDALIKSPQSLSFLNELFKLYEKPRTTKPKVTYFWGPNIDDTIEYVKKYIGKRDAYYKSPISTEYFGYDAHDLCVFVGFNCCWNNPLEMEMITSSLPLIVAGRQFKSDIIIIDNADPATYRGKLQNMTEINISLPDEVIVYEPTK